MTGPPIPEVWSVDRRDCGVAGAVLARAFSDTDQWAAVVPDERARGRKLEQMFTGTVKLTLSAGGVAERTARFEGVALWLPPARDLGIWSMVKSGFASARFTVTPPYPNLRRLLAMLNQFDTARKQRMPHPHWYLLALGVDPRHQKRAFGPALVIEGNRRADADGVPIYVETETGPTVAFYRKLGFVVVDEIIIDAYELPFSLMVRQPGSAAMLSG